MLCMQNSLNMVMFMGLSLFDYLSWVIMTLNYDNTDEITFPVLTLT